MPQPDSSPVRLRPALDAVPAYVAGRPAPVLDGVTTYKISSNENPYPPLPSVVRRLAETAGRVNRYPDMANAALKQALAELAGLDPSTVSVGPGSTGVLAQFIQAFCDPGDEVVFAWRSFEAYPILVQLAGAVAVPVPLTEAGEHDLDAMAAAVTDRTRLVLVCSPNNPTGTVVGHDAAREFLRQVPAHVPVLWDEAYVEFVRDPRAADALALLRDFPNLIVMRTFSKAYGLAGARVGYAYSHPAPAAANAKTAVPFSVNLFAQDAALHSLDAWDELRGRVDALAAERERVEAELARQGWRLPASQSNFLWFALGADSEAFDLACEAAGLVVRRFGDEGVRVTIGETEANDRLLRIAAGFESPLRSTD